MLWERKLGHGSIMNSDEENKVHKKGGDKRWMCTDDYPNLQFPLTVSIPETSGLTFYPCLGTSWKQVETLK